jgi:hypothetical protein
MFPFQFHFGCPRLQSTCEGLVSHNPSSLTNCHALNCASPTGFTRPFLRKGASMLSMFCVEVTIFSEIAPFAGIALVGVNVVGRV